MAAGKNDTGWINGSRKQANLINDNQRRWKPTTLWKETDKKKKKKIDCNYILYDVSSGQHGQVSHPFLSYFLSPIVPRRWSRWGQTSKPLRVAYVLLCLVSAQILRALPLLKRESDCGGPPVAPSIRSFLIFVSRCCFVFRFCFCFCFILSLSLWIVSSTVPVL